MKNEAAVASERSVLIPTIIDRVKLPLEFRRKQTADLVDWAGDESHSGFQAVCEGVRNKLSGELGHQPLPLQKHKWRWNRPWALSSVVSIAVAIVASVSSIYFADLGSKTSVLPQLVFVWNETTGWFLRNDGNGTAFNVIVAHQPHSISKWKEPTILYPIPKGEKVLICWAGQNPDKLIAIYSDAHKRKYTSFTDDDVTKINSGDGMRNWSESDVRRVWERPCD